MFCMYLLLLFRFLLDVLFNRIVKVIVKVIDVNDAGLVMYLMHELINVYHKININHMDLVPVVDIMLIKNHMIHVV
jgi:hypothetical protein